MLSNNKNVGQHQKGKDVFPKCEEAIKHNLKPLKCFFLCKKMSFHMSVNGFHLTIGDITAYQEIDTGKI